MLPIPPFTEAEKSLIPARQVGFAAAQPRYGDAQAEESFQIPLGGRRGRYGDKKTRGHLRGCSKEKISTPQKTGHIDHSKW